MIGCFALVIKSRMPPMRLLDYPYFGLILGQCRVVFEWFLKEKNIKNNFKIGCKGTKNIWNMQIFGDEKYMKGRKERARRAIQLPWNYQEREGRMLSGKINEAKGRLWEPMSECNSDAMDEESGGIPPRTGQKDHAGVPVESLWTGVRRSALRLIGRHPSERFFFCTYIGVCTVVLLSRKGTIISDICLPCGHSPVATFASCSPYVRGKAFFLQKTDCRPYV